MENLLSSSNEIKQSSTSKRIAVIGANGYGGIQSIRLLSDHPDFKVTYLGGERTVGTRLSELCPFFKFQEDLVVESPDPNKIGELADYAILSLPNGISSQLAPELLERNVKVIDLSADFRFRSLDQWKNIYVNEASNSNRSDNLLCSEAIYGLPEWNATDISQARLIAAPGCFPTASLLALLPFLSQGLIEQDGIVIDAKSGTSGGGRNPKENLLLSEASESISPYGVIGHRHTPEIEQQASKVAGMNIQLQFTPHLVPMVRGILATVYARLRDPGLTADDCSTVLRALYRNNTNIEVLPVGIYPSTKWVRNTNKVILSVQVDVRNGRLVIMSAIDNLIKGQAGQAIDCINIVEGLPQGYGLPLETYYP